MSTQTIKQRNNVMTIAVVLYAAMAHHANGQDVFLKIHCIGCHGPKTQEASLRIDSLPNDLTQPDVFAKWVQIHDRIARHEMPPKDAEQPTDGQRAAFVKKLGEQLHNASQAKQRRDGRVIVRRLNRNEYQYTLHDLLGIGVELKSLLSEDNKVAGFDNISAGLETSATHLVRYQEAADRALAALYPARVLLRESKTPRLRLTGKEYLESRQEVHRKGIEPYIRIEGDTFIYGAQLYKHGSVHTPPAPRTGRLAGRYRFRASMRAINTDQPIPVTIGRISTDRFGHEKLEHLLDIRDALPNQTRVIEVTADLAANEQVYLSPNSLTLFRSLPKSSDGKPGVPDFKDPCLAVDWIELEGPLTAVRCTLPSTAMQPTSFALARCEPSVWACAVLRRFTFPSQNVREEFSHVRSGVPYN